MKSGPAVNALLVHLQGRRQAAARSERCAFVSHLIKYCMQHRGGTLIFLTDMKGTGSFPCVPIHPIVVCDFHGGA